MTDESSRSALLLILGATVVWLWRSDAALNYVRPWLMPYLVVSAVVLLLLGLLPPLGLLRRRPAGHEEGHGHGHERARVGWLLLVPVLVVLLIQPAALGSYAVSGRSGVPGEGDSAFSPLSSPVRGAVPMTLVEFVTRALYDRNQSLAGVRVRLVGFVAPGDGAESYRLTRFSIFCCAADAAAVQVVVRGDHTQWHPDQWLEVEGQWLRRPVAAAKDPNPQLPVLTVDLVRPIAQPHEPYE
jgi:uncharacterized repeat protein (TIGR03943 family)